MAGGLSGQGAPTQKGTGLQAGHWVFLQGQGRREGSKGGQGEVAEGAEKAG